MRGPRYSSRLLIASVVISIMLYATPVWKETLRMSVNANKLSAVYRRTALKVWFAVRAVSDDVAFVILGMMPIDILATEMINVYNTRSIFPLSQMKKAEREKSISRWQQ